MRIHLSADSAGFAFAHSLIERLEREGDVVYHGAETFDHGDDYPAYAIACAQAVVEDEDRGIDVRGVVVGATGAGEAIVANKVAGVRAVLATSPETAILARAHADANVLAIGVELTNSALSTAIVEAFLSSPFLVDADDVRRIIYTAEYESAGTIEGWAIA
ncbi:RpiB/LacA/LacB family sugar-phosphate isomerase [Subtercola endophyticus]|uniref:RpiB/LacA/LacB family sugar-phosphate isomerase n=1 Tax=Subtercola endophyticus TaxID=2895559 RepID=UPI001E5115D4|nr:RpiB/LacA/LacB family sugar-phosphate isomerase [Subtercola endophyticus]UFS58783.1 RpiB/LacA/LacB family sugar-phosphate isomerase [Subtercola endophyticus]